MENKFLVRNIALVVIIILAYYYFMHDKDHSIEKEALDIELIITLFLAIIYTFTHDNPLWKQFYWIWRIVIALTLVAYLFKVVDRRKAGWESTAVGTLALLFVIGGKGLLGGSGSTARL